MPMLDPAMPPAPVPEPGWYPDPVTDGRSERWWTGRSWAGYSRPRVDPRVVPAMSVPTTERRSSRSTALLSLILGLLALVIAIGGVLGQGGGWMWTGAFAAVALGVRVLTMRARTGTSVVLASIGIGSGALASVMLLALFLLPFQSSRPVAYSGSVIAAAPQNVPLGAPSEVPSQMPSALPSPTASVAPSPAPSSGILEVVPRQPLPDDAVDSYTTVAVRSVTSATAGCGVVRAEPDPFPVGQPAATAGRRAQDYGSLQLQAMRNALVYPAKVTKPMTWPTSLDMDPETRVVFTPAPACAPLGVLPMGDELHFATSPDHGQIVIAIWSPDYRTGNIWRSVDDTLYAL